MFTILVVIVLLIFAIKAFMNMNEELGESIYPVKYKTQVEKYAEEYKLDKALVYAVIKTESNFIEEAESGVGAMGLMQIMPSTFEWLQSMTKGEVTMDSDSLLDADVNIEYGCIFLQFLLDRYSEENTAVAAYNAGFGAVDGWLEDTSYSKDGKNLDYIPYPETSNYVDKVVEAKKHYTADKNR